MQSYRPPQAITNVSDLKRGDIILYVEKYEEMDTVKYLIQSFVMSSASNLVGHAGICTGQDKEKNTYQIVHNTRAKVTVICEDKKKGDKTMLIFRLTPEHQAIAEKAA